MGRITDIYARIADLELRITALENEKFGKERPEAKPLAVEEMKDDDLDELEG